MMKFKNLLAITMMAFYAVSCSNNGNTIAVSKMVAGEYVGTVTMNVGNTSFDPAEASVKLTADGDATVSIVLPEAGTGKMVIPSITINAVAVSTIDGMTYKLAETPYTQEGSMSITGNVSGVVKNGNAQITYSAKPGAMPMNINFEFTGSKK